LEVISARS